MAVSGPTCQHRQKGPSGTADRGGADQQPAAGVVSGRDPEVNAGSIYEVLLEATVVIVSGRLYVDSDTRDEYVAACLEVIEQARAAPGCLDFVLSVDPIEADRINVYEQWESDAHLHDFRSAGPELDQAAALRRAQVMKYRVSCVEPA